MEKNPRVLVVANNCFSLTNSNGRTLGNFFVGWPKECLAEFSLGLDNPNYDLCTNYFCVKDKEALKAFFVGAKNVGLYHTPCRKMQNQSLNQVDKRYRKTALKMLIRHMVWQSGRWKNKRFKQWIEDFKPEIVLIQNGDSAFMLSIAWCIAKARNIPLIFFNTEGYYFFKKNYMGRHWTDFICLPLYQWLYKRTYRKVMDYATHSVYINQRLKDDYDREFHKPSTILYTSSDLKFKPKAINLKQPTFSYLGNFGFNRPKVLAEVASVLNEINSQFHLDIYGKARQEIIDFFNQVPAINYCGFINYNQVIEVMRNSDILFHVETQELEIQEQLRYGFSTKIADSISCGSNFILYASPEIACSQYISETKSAWFVKDKKSLKEVVLQILYNESARKNVLDKAQIIAHENHNMEYNTILFQKLLKEIYCVKKQK